MAAVTSGEYMLLLSSFDPSPPICHGGNPVIKENKHSRTEFFVLQKIDSFKVIKNELSLIHKQKIANASNMLKFENIS